MNNSPKLEKELNNMYHILNTTKYQRPLNSKRSDELIKELIWFKDQVMLDVQITFWIRNVISLMDQSFNKNDKRYKIISELQQDIIDVTLLKCIGYISASLESNIYISTKDSTIEQFMLKTILSNKSKKFNLQLARLFSYQEFCHRNLVERKDAIKILKQA